ncbi:hypothetical protein ACRPOS_001040 [Bartonella heixiaziensis]|uniref:hypothetical protein n=1 Tax=Bartonella heixiaziensis TaxID=1461000 RepID=UPI0039089EE1
MGGISLLAYSDYEIIRECPSKFFILSTKQWFSSVFMQAFNVWFDNHFSEDLSSFDHLSSLTFFIFLVKKELENLRETLFKKEKKKSN